MSKKNQAGTRAEKQNDLYQVSGFFQFWTKWKVGWILVGALTIFYIIYYKIYAGHFPPQSFVRETRFFTLNLPWFWVYLLQVLFLLSLKFWIDFIFFIWNKSDKYDDIIKDNIGGIIGLIIGLIIGGIIGVIIGLIIGGIIGLIIGGFIGGIIGVIIFDILTDFVKRIRK